MFFLGVIVAMLSLVATIRNFGDVNREMAASVGEIFGAVYDKTAADSLYLWIVRCWL